LGEWVLEAKTMSGSNMGEHMYIPRIVLNARSTKWSSSCCVVEVPNLILLSNDNLENSGANALSGWYLFVKDCICTASTMLPLMFLPSSYMHFVYSVD
jgi:hypothetical protein